MISVELVQRVRDIVESGYYQRLQPPLREKKSLCDKIESMQEEGQLPIICEISTAMPEHGLLMPTRRYASDLIDRLANSYDLCALDLWIEPREHAGDLRWLAKDLRMPIIHNDWILDTRQIVGGDAVVLDISFIEFCSADLHELIEAAHEQDMEAIVQVRGELQMSTAKRSEADCIMINNFGMNGSGANVSVTIEALKKNGTGRPVISAQGIDRAQDVRNLVKAGVSAIELNAYQSCNGSFENKLEMAKKALRGKSGAEN